MLCKTLSSYRYRTNICNLIRLCTQFGENNVEAVAALFDISTHELQKYAKNCPKLFSRPVDDVIDMYKFCKEVGYSNQSILDNISLLTGKCLQKAEHYKALQETGCSHIMPTLLNRAHHYMFSNIKEFKRKQYLDAHINVVEEFMQYLDPKIALPPVLNKKLDVIDNMKWTDIHTIVLKEWLKVKLDANEADIYKLFKIHKVFSSKSFRTIKTNIYLAKSVGMTNEKILKCGYLLGNYPSNVEQVLRDHSNIAGMDIRKAMKTNPKLMMTNSKKLTKMYEMLKEFGIPDEMIQKKHQIFTMSINTVRGRLEEIYGIPELKVLSEVANTLHLVLHKKKIDTRMNHLRKCQLQCATSQVFKNVSDTYFDNYIKVGRDVNSVKDVTKFFYKLFQNSSKSETARRIKLHPYNNCVPFLAIQNTYNHLIKNGYFPDDIYEAMHILLYSTLETVP